MMGTQVDVTLRGVSVEPEKAVLHDESSHMMKKLAKDKTWSL